MSIDLFPQTREEISTYRLFNIIMGETSGECCDFSVGLGNWDQLRAVDHIVDIMTKDGEFEHGSFEGALELALVVCWFHDRY